MTTPEYTQHPHENENEELVAACKNLYDIMSRPFERPFESLGYSLELEAAPRRDAALYLPGGIREGIETAFHADFVRGRDWRILFRHDETLAGPVVDTVSIPFRDGEGRQIPIIFKRFANLKLYIPLVEGSEGKGLRQWQSEDQELEKTVFGRSKDVYVTDEQMTTLIEEAGLHLGFSPADLNLESIAKRLANIPNWRRREQIITPVAPNLQVILVKESVFASEGTLADSGGVITVYCESVLNDRMREQLVISMPIDGMSVETPEIVVRRISPSSDAADIVNYGPNAYKITEASRVALTVEMADDLSLDLLEYLGDIA